MDAALTGRDATEALQIVMRLGDGFCGRKVLHSLRSHVGRSRLRAALLTARGGRRPPEVACHVAVTPRETRRAPRRRGVSVTPSSAPSRPAVPPLRGC